MFIIFSRSVFYWIWTNLIIYINREDLIFIKKCSLFLLDNIFRRLVGVEDSYYVISNKRKKYEKNPQKDGKT